MYYITGFQTTVCVIAWHAVNMLWDGSVCLCDLLSFYGWCLSDLLTYHDVYVCPANTLKL